MSMWDFNRELSVRLIFLVFVAWFLLDIVAALLSLPCRCSYIHIRGHSTYVTFSNRVENHEHVGL